MNSSGFKEKILKVLKEIKGSGSFVSTNNSQFIFPDLEIKGVGEIGFPVSPIEVKEMIKVAQKAPFGKGSKTVLDANVRSAWEIDAAKISFNNNDWSKFIERIIEQIKPELGIQEHQVTANLYKLLIYEKGDFFLAHKDSEKEKGMFGTLIIGLPAKHTGGELIIKFDGRTETIDFSGPANQYKIPYAAFYADCDHEIAPVTSGYRVCLTYNLIQQKGEEKIQMRQLEGYANQLAEILKHAEGDKNIPKIILLGHQYTPSNYTMETLKLNDRPKAESLILAAQKAGYYAKMGLVTSYQMGELLGDDDYGSSRYRSRGRYDYDDDDEDDAENGEMGEVYDEHVSVEHWMQGGIPPLGNIQFEKEDIISEVEINEGEPIEKEAEGYTGNAGMEMTYWYHYGAVFLWPQKYQYDVLITLDTGNKLEWISYYNNRWSEVSRYEITIIKQLVEAGLEESIGRGHLDYSSIAELLINLKDETYLTEKGTAILINYFKQITLESWLKLFASYPAGCFELIFTTIGELSNKLLVNHLLSILTELSNQPNYTLFVKNQTNRIPPYLQNLDLSAIDTPNVAQDIFRKVIQLSKLKTGDEVWIKETGDALLKNINRDYVNDVLVVVILESDTELVLVHNIKEKCKEDLAKRVNNKPEPPTDWSRPLPDKPDNKKIWSILADFLQSPTQQVFDYQKKQNFRTDMEYAIRSVTIDLKMETIKKKSPYTLRLTKTQDAYEREMAKWRKDVELLSKINNLN